MSQRHEHPRAQEFAERMTSLAGSNQIDLSTDPQEAADAVLCEALHASGMKAVADAYQSYKADLKSDEDDDPEGIFAPPLFPSPYGEVDSMGRPIARKS